MEKKGSHIVGILIINVKKNKVSLSHFHNNNFTFVFPPKRFPCSYFINHEENNHNTKTCVCLCDPVMVKCWQKAHCLLHFPHGEWMLNRAVYHWKYNSRTQSSNLSDIKCSSSTFLINGKDKLPMAREGKSKSKIISRHEYNISCCFIPVSVRAFIVLAAGNLHWYQLSVSGCCHGQ